MPTPQPIEHRSCEPDGEPDRVRTAARCVAWRCRGRGWCSPRDHGCPRGEPWRRATRRRGRRSGPGPAAGCRRAGATPRPSRVVSSTSASPGRCPSRPSSAARTRRRARRRRSRRPGGGWRPVGLASAPTDDEHAPRCRPGPRQGTHRRRRQVHRRRLPGSHRDHGGDRPQRQHAGSSVRTTAWAAARRRVVCPTSRTSQRPASSSPRSSLVASISPQTAPTMLSTPRLRQAVKPATVSMLRRRADERVEAEVRAEGDGQLLAGGRGLVGRRVAERRRGDVEAEHQPPHRARARRLRSGQRGDDRAGRPSRRPGVAESPLTRIRSAVSAGIARARPASVAP